MSNNIVDILVCVDAESIVNNYHLSPDHSIQVDNKYMYYIVRSKAKGTYYAPTDNATGEMIITVNSGDSIRWRPISLTQQYYYAVLLQTMSGGEVSVNISQPELFISPINVPYTDSDDPNNCHMVTSYYHQSEAIAPTKDTFDRSENYLWNMSIYQGANLIGYIDHDPFIIVKG
ncbi:AidA/PixA family protein [Photorhabdus sp. SF281]|uniref:AidA/PixA family protein n=1 Tax=Photorhabdus sp. SF281 TaxID=3459527 RepID=UPI0040449E25